MQLDYEKNKGLIPVIVQDATNMQVLMLGYMNPAALAVTKATKKVTFYSRSKKRLWTKGETSGNYLHLVDITQDCDADTLLVMANPTGPVCHKGTDSCFGNVSEKGFIYSLEQTIHERIKQNTNSSYTTSLYKKGTAKVAQKVGEEAVELVIEAMGQNQELFLNEAADLLYHYLLLLRSKNTNLEAVQALLRQRAKKN
ncbi:MAG: bifunctional phosphoribosyl-AMP cyclohydrolase/phosphoribosyl-ATP diphosphatase HisIE [Gilvibacter sp.]